MPELFDPASPASWRKLHPKSTVTLRDEQTVHEMLDAGETDVSAGRDYFVKSMVEIHEMNKVAEWLLFELESPRDEDNVWLVVKIAGGDLSLGVYFAADGLEPGHRQDMLDREFYWMFEEPPDPDNYRVLDLAYAGRLELPVMDGDEERLVEFDKLGAAEFHGKVRFTPYVDGMMDMMATVAEYTTTAAVPNPRVLIFEVGRPDNKYGGNITFLQGTGIRASEVDVLPLS